jgi:V-type H+-transporting ATPase subunit A
MLGLRPRLKARPSFLDLVRQKHIDQISQSSLDADDRPKQIPLPQSPLAAALRVRAESSPPPYILEEETPNQGEQKQVKMAPVSLMRGGDEVGCS